MTNLLFQECMGCQRKNCIGCSIIGEENKEMADGAWDQQEAGNHYKTMVIQPMEYSMANGFNALQHTSIKYISRYKDKNGLEDLHKARHCIDMLIEYEEEGHGG